MYICGKFMKDNTDALKRNGVAKEVVIAPDGKTQFNSMTFNAETGKLEIHEGKNIICVTDRVGFYEEAIVKYTLMRNGMLITLLEGTMYIDNGEGSAIKLGADGTTNPVTAPSKVHWMSYDELPSYLSYGIAKEFSVPHNSDLHDYMNNLSFVCRCVHNVEKSSHTFCFRTLEWHKDLGKTEFISNTTNEPFEVVVKKPVKSGLNKLLEEVARAEGTAVDEEEDF